MTTEFSHPKIRKDTYSLPGINWDTNLLIYHEENFGNAAVERIILKCNHTIMFGD